MRLMNKRPRTELTSVLELMDEIGQCGHAALADVFREHAFVGCVDSNRCAIQVICLEKKIFFFFFFFYKSIIAKENLPF